MNRTILALTAIAIGCVPTKEIIRPLSSEPTTTQNISEITASRCAAELTQAEQALRTAPCGDEQFLLESDYAWDCRNTDQNFDGNHENLHVGLANNVAECALKPEVDTARLECWLEMIRYADQFYGTINNCGQGLDTQDSELRQVKLACDEVHTTPTRPEDHRLQSAYQNLITEAETDRQKCERKNPSK